MASPTPFGAPMKAHFLLDPNYNNLNHGLSSSSSSLTAVTDETRLLRYLPFSGP
jgi:hypothetical protein